MRLKSLNFTDHPDGASEWRLGTLTLGDVNLVVGVNASGKSRALAAIGNLAWLISGKAKLGFRTSDADCHAEFEHDGKTVIYILRCRAGKVIEEVFKEDGNVRMTRGIGGTGIIDIEQEGNEKQKFQTPDTDLAIVARKDSIQHSFFDSLHDWAASVYRYSFGSPLGKQSISIEIQNMKFPLDPRNQEEVINIFSAGVAAYGDEFKNSIKQDMARLNYALDDVGATAPTLIPASQFPGPAKYLYAKEQDLNCVTEQWEMSQGMFRALSMIIQLTFSQMAAKPACIIVDDIGEGLDFGRSCALIELLMQKATAAKVQLIMSTNDRFVMNKVPLDAWSVLQREKGASKVYNSVNSKKIFEEFSFTGLNNFDFLATDFVHEGLEESKGS